MKKLKNKLLRSPFKVPEGYFENFEAKLMEKIQPPLREKPSFKIFQIKVYKWAIAAAVLLLLGTIFLKNQIYKNITTGNNMNTISLDKVEFSDEDIIEYLEISNEMDTEFIIENL